MIVDESKTAHETHEVFNQPPPLEDYNVLGSDVAAMDAVEREGGAWAKDHILEYGAHLGTKHFLHQAALANMNGPELKSYDRFGYRTDEVEYHPAYHAFMALGMKYEVHAFPWNRKEKGAHVARNAMGYALAQVEPGHGCPLTMTFAVVPSLRHQPDVAAEWEPRVCSNKYDPRFVPASEKTGCTLGMAMTEKQGGSDVRANTTYATPIGAGGPGGEYELTGHKWFCSAPMCDAFLTLAKTESGISCFLVPRFLPDGTKNRFLIQRLKDKLGNRSNASSEIEYRDTWGRMIGEEGRGVRTIIDMVGHTRLDCIGGSAGLMRMAVAQAIHHCSHRSAFGKTLVDQPLMRNVLADLALESEAAVSTLLRMSRAFDEAEDSPAQKALARIGTAVSKYWVCKRAPHMIYECMECHGGNGYVEEHILARHYREAPVNSIWEGSGNVMCLDLLRAMQKEPDTVPALMMELEKARGADKRYDAHVDKVQAELANPEDAELRARRVMEMLAKAVQASILVQHAPTYVADAFCASRLDVDRGREYGTLPPGVDFDAIIDRARPQIG